MLLCPLKRYAHKNKLLIFEVSQQEHVVAFHFSKEIEGTHLLGTVYFPDIQGILKIDTVSLTKVQIQAR